MSKLKTIKLVAVIGTVILLSSSMFTVAENEYKCVKRFAKVRNIVSEAGLSFKIPFIDTTQTLPKNKMHYDLAPSDVLTSDKKSLVVDTYLIWKIVDPLEFIKTVGSTSEMENRLDAATYNATKTSFGKTSQAEVVGEVLRADETPTVSISGRERLNTEILESVNNQVSSYGVEVDFVEIKRIDLPTDNETAVHNRMISERNQMATAFIAEGDLEANKIKNDTDKQTSVIVSQAQAQSEAIRGEAEAEYMKILSDTYSNPQKAEFYKFIKSLEALEESMTGEKTLILSEDSMLTKLFME